MNTGSIVAIIVLVVIGLAWLLLKGRRRGGDDAEALSPRQADGMIEQAPTVTAVPVEAAPPAPAPSSPAEASAPALAKPSVPVARPASVPDAKPAPPPESVTVILARPRPPAPVVERVLVLEQADGAEWNAARPIALSAVQGAAVASAMTATRPGPGEGAVDAIQFDAGSAIRIARGDLDTLRAVAAARAASAHGKARWLDSAVATALAATALAALASERWLDGLGDEMRDLKTALAALPPKLAAQGDGRLKALVQDLSRFAREARDNYVSVIGKSAFRERVGEGCERAAVAWHELVASADAARQQLELVAATPRFGEVQIERALSQWRELQSQERLQEIAARVLAGMHTLRLALGDAAPSAGVDPLASAAAAVRAGLDQDRDLSARLAEREKSAKGDPYVGRAEFEANRAALRKLLDKPVTDSTALAMRRLDAAAATEPLDAGSGAPSRLLVQRPPGEGAGSLRWSREPA
jgi:hypothetical protein